MSTNAGPELEDIQRLLGALGSDLKKIEDLNQDVATIHLADRLRLLELFQAEHKRKVRLRNVAYGILGGVVLSAGLLVFLGGVTAFPAYVAIGLAAVAGFILNLKLDSDIRRTRYLILAERERLRRSLLELQSGENRS